MIRDFVNKVSESMVSAGVVERSRVLVALSGGADSVALLRVLLSLGYDCTAVHCNFHLRGDESIRDEQFVRDLCQRLKVELEVAHFEASAYAQKNGVSLEMACRDLRYRRFEEVRSFYGCEVIVVAHHADDDVETFFLNLLRGTGIAGLSGMKTRSGRIVRPMLSLGRDEIETYLHELKQDYVVDSTNLENDFARNKIRNVIIPSVRECFPYADKSIRTTLQNLKGCNAVFQESVEQARGNILTRQGEVVRMSIAGLLESASPETIAHELLGPYGFNAAQTADILRSAQAGNVGAIFRSADYVAEVGRSSIELLPNRMLEEDLQPIEISSLLHVGDLPIDLRVSVVDYGPGFCFESNPSVAYFDDRILHQSLTLRRWREGDRFRPFGMRGTQKLSDYFSDHHFSLFEKKMTWLLCAGDVIVWVVGHRASAEFSVTASSCRVVVVEANTERQ